MKIERDEKREAFGFENLEVWKRAIELAKTIYEMTASFPSEERFGLVTQMRRAVVSVSANIAEGFSRWSPNEQSRFMEISFGSLMELISEAKIAEQQNFLSNSDYTKLHAEAEDISRMLSGLRRSLLRREESRGRVEESRRK